MPTLSVSQVASIVGGEFKSNEWTPETIISSVVIDSRTVFDPSSSLFFAIKTERNDGHKYIADLIHSGVHAFVVSDFSEEYLKQEHCSFVVVHNTLEALQKLASWNRSLYQIPVVGITGSNGKTIVKEWLFELLQQHSVLRSPKSYNSQVGVPLSVWNLEPGYDMAIFEAGISKPEEMEHLQKMIRPTIGILTNIGQAHQENFSSMEQKLKEKLKLFKESDTLIYCKDQPLVDSIVLTEVSPSVKLFAWSFKDATADLYLKVKKVKDGVELDYSGFYSEHDLKSYSERHEYRLFLPFQDAANLENAGQCLAFILSQHYENPAILEAFAHLQPVAMRLEMKEGINNCLLINDYYNSDINSLQIALSFLNNHAKAPYSRKTVILSDIHQAGIPDKQLYQEVARMLQLNKVNHLIGIGPAIRKRADLFAMPCEFYESTDQFMEAFQPEGFHQECILLKGARDFHFERLSSVLQKKYHQTVLEINLNALVNNLNLFRSMLRPDTRIMVMVKAFSYGSGMAEIARILQFHKVDYLAVAVADEGVELRQAGIDLPIVVMNPEAHSFENMIEFRLEPNIYSLEILDAFRKVLQQNAVVRYPIHIKLDTGMHRLGFDSEEKVALLVEKLINQEQMVVRSVFSHLAGADESVHDDFTLGQIQQFEKFSAMIAEKLPYKIFRHILNSAGIERFSHYQFEMVRLGIGLYGVSALGNTQIYSISRLKTSISQLRHIPAGQTVGYGRKGVVTRDSQIAVLPIGYADGYDRRLSNGVGKVYVNGKVVPVIGNICMDMCMIDVTGLQVAVGDEVELMGEHILVSDIAQTIGTIPYEILTGISQRVKRVYLQE
ncbi:MAG TPA: bifunctional UDP-N-acetylmuramoyl-tripeptide:D-alanyl-D-alanine ligase/alanine racemase [Prolixibacteraceae bacterium]|nr:bifunctional UDP-N-acetylmuramoyl-tripeptide:D-alanyl-D-alanine ligase/alanine racemase [Prolixibacteraceae bacterium]